MVEPRANFSREPDEPGSIHRCPHDSFPARDRLRVEWRESSPAESRTLSGSAFAMECCPVPKCWKTSWPVIVTETSGPRAAPVTRSAAPCMGVMPSASCGRLPRATESDRGPRVDRLARRAAAVKSPTASFAISASKPFSFLTRSIQSERALSPSSLTRTRCDRSHDRPELDETSTRTAIARSTRADRPCLRPSPWCRRGAEDQIARRRSRRGFA